MKVDVILSGVGGQGILSIAAAISHAAIRKNLYVKQSETHGMSQRGGAVVAHLRIAGKPVWSDLIPLGKADIILSVEPLEALRYLPYLSSSGFVITNSVSIANISDYPDPEEIMGELQRLPRTVIFDADQLAKEAGNIRASNMVILGAASSLLGLEKEDLKSGIIEIFRNKGNDIIELNIRAFEIGAKYAPLLPQ